MTMRPLRCNRRHRQRALHRFTGRFWGVGLVREQIRLATVCWPKEKAFPMKLQSSNSAWIRRASIAAVAATVVAGCTFGAALPANAEDLGDVTRALSALSDQGYTMLAGAAVTAPGSTVMGNIGAGAAITAPGSTIRGDLTAGAAITVDDGTIYGQLNDSTAPGGLSDIDNAYDTLTSPAAVSGANELDADLAEGTMIHAGVNHISSAAAITGNITISANAGDKVTIIVDGALDTTAGTIVKLEASDSSFDAVEPSSIYWVTAGATTLGASSTFVGNIVSYAAVTVGASSTVQGHIYADNGAITLGDGVTVAP